MNTCPTCNKVFDPKQNSKNLPFCSERCKMVDLGDWLTEKHRIPDDDLNLPEAIPEELENDKKH